MRGQHEEEEDPKRSSEAVALRLGFDSRLRRNTALPESVEQGHTSMRTLVTHSISLRVNP